MRENFRFWGTSCDPRGVTFVNFHWITAGLIGLGCAQLPMGLVTHGIAQSISELYLIIFVLSSTPKIKFVICTYFGPSRPN